MIELFTWATLEMSRLVDLDVEDRKISVEVKANPQRARSFPDYNSTERAQVHSLLLSPTAMLSMPLNDDASISVMTVMGLCMPLYILG